MLHSLGAKSDSSPAGVEGVWARRMALLSMCSRPSGGFEEFPVLGRVPTDSTLGQVGRAYCTPPLSWLATCAVQLLGTWSESSAGWEGACCTPQLVASWHYRPAS